MNDMISSLLNSYLSELEFLKSTKRKEVADALAEARSHGDLSENSEYDEAKNEQAKLEARINTLEHTIQQLKNTNVIQSSKPEDIGKVKVGSIVTLYDHSYKEYLTFKIAPDDHGDPLYNDSISFTSPVGKAIKDKYSGEKVTVNPPVGYNQFTIMHVSGEEQSPNYKGPVKLNIN